MGDTGGLAVIAPLFILAAFANLLAERSHDSRAPGTFTLNIRLGTWKARLSINPAPAMRVEYLWEVVYRAAVRIPLGTALFEKVVSGASSLTYCHTRSIVKWCGHLAWSSACDT